MNAARVHVLCAKGHSALLLYSDVLPFGPYDLPFSSYDNQYSALWTKSLQLHALLQGEAASTSWGLLCIQAEQL